MATGRAFQAITAEPWAIQADWLRVMAAISLRTETPERGRARELADNGQRTRRDLNAQLDTMYLGAAATRLDGGSGRAWLKDGVAVIPMFGPIFPRANMITDFSGGTTLTDMQRDLEAAMSNDAVNCIVYAVDSPGGAVSGIQAHADEIAAANKMKPICAFVMGTAASAAYWLATAAGRIAMDRTGVVGSIGVVVAVPKQVQPDGNGDMTVEVVSSNAPQKRVDPMTDDGLAEIRNGLDALEAVFLGDVAARRGVKVDAVKSDFGQGGVVVGADAVTRGMADALTSFSAELARMARVGRARKSAPARQ